MKIAVIIFFILTLSCLFVFIHVKKSNNFVSPIGKNILFQEKPLDKYTYNVLKNRRSEVSEIKLGKELINSDKYTSRLFFFYTSGKKVSGLINVPKTSGSVPVIVMIRGYVDKKAFQSGIGTKYTGEAFAKNGYLTLAPDFLGYGESDPAVKDAMEDRFMTYTTVLDLLASIKNLNRDLKNAGFNDLEVNVAKIGIWGHSNGGQISLSVLEISGGSYPTVLWAPVSKPFPYSILYYTDDIPDHGKALRKVVSDFEENYDSEKYSLTNFFNWISAPIQVYQGTADEAVPEKWSYDLYQNLKEATKEAELFVYPGEDHNFSKGSWESIVKQNINFYNKYLVK